MQQLTSWLSECSLNHPLCKPIRGLLPKRLIKVDGEDLKLIYTEEITDSNLEYATLSHCWGEVECTLTTKSSEKSHQEKMDFNKLQRSFQDAIQITRQLGLPYLWIDSLCILQGDQLEWESETLVLRSSADGAYQPPEGPPQVVTHGEPGVVELR